MGGLSALVFRGALRGESPHKGELQGLGVRGLARDHFARLIMGRELTVAE